VEAAKRFGADVVIAEPEYCLSRLHLRYDDIVTNAVFRQGDDIVDGQEKPDPLGLGLLERGLHQL
jgi:hypothetical protein